MGVLSKVFFEDDNVPFFADFATYFFRKYLSPDEFVYFALLPRLKPIPCPYLQYCWDLAFYTSAERFWILQSHWWLRWKCLSHRWDFIKSHYVDLYYYRLLWTMAMFMLHMTPVQTKKLTLKELSIRLEPRVSQKSEKNVSSSSTGSLSSSNIWLKKVGAWNRRDVFKFYHFIKFCKHIRGQNWRQRKCM